MSKLSAHGAFEILYSVAEVRAIDRNAIGVEGIPGYTLMTRAAEAACDFAVQMFPAARRWQVLCGSGNNGGDGYVLARLAAAQGIEVDVITVSSPGSLTGDAKRAHHDYTQTGGVAREWPADLDREATLLVDALLGSGLARPIGGRYAAAVEAINAHTAPVLALDIPTGLSGDSGEILGGAVRANATMTFVGHKAGLYLRDGPAMCGVIECAMLDIPAACRTSVDGVLRRMLPAARAALLPPRPRDAHKGTFGHVVVVGGGPGMPGAALLSAAAALRSGAGRVSVVVHPTQVAAVVGGRPELMCHGADTAADVAPLLASADVLALGPGLGRDSWAKDLFGAVMALDAPLVIDADGLNLLAAAPKRSERWVLTPHPGEAARLLGSNVAAVQEDRVTALDELARRYGGHIVLKGAGSLVNASSGPPWLCSAGNPGMASPGMGDVLTGVVAALLAQGLGAEEAAVLGMEIHAQAGDRAAHGGERGLLAMDVVEELRECVNP